MKIINIIYFLFLIIPFSPQADIVYLKDGGKVEGIIKLKDDNGVLIQISVGEMKIEKNDIDSIVYTKGSEKEKMVQLWEESRNNIDKKREIALSNELQKKKNKKVRYKLKPVKIFIVEWCGWCKKLMEYFQSNNVEFISCDIEKSVSCKNEYADYGKGYKGFPLTVIGNTVIHGYDIKKVEKALRDTSAWEIEQ